MLAASVAQQQLRTKLHITTQVAEASVWPASRSLSPSLLECIVNKPHIEMQLHHIRNMRQEHELVLTRTNKAQQPRCGTIVNIGIA
jgi:hypothetical protein